MAMPLHRGNQRRQKCFQPFATDAIGSFPKDNERLLYGLVVYPLAYASPGWVDCCAKHANRMLAVIARQSHKFIENADSLLTPRAATLLSNRFDQILPCRHAELPPHKPRPSSSMTGSRLREATTPPR